MKKRLSDKINKNNIDLDSLNSENIIKLLLEKISETKKSRGLIEKRKNIPLSVFKNKKLGILEAIVKYLKEECKYKYSKIAKILNRDDRTIWTTYNNAKKRSKKPLYIKESDFDIPVEIFSKKKYSALESMSVYLRDKFELGYTDIGKMLGRNPKTIWTTYKRAKKK